MIGLLRRPWIRFVNRLTFIQLNALREAGIPQQLAALDARLADIGLQIGQRIGLIEERQGDTASHIGQIENRLAETASQGAQIVNGLAETASQGAQIVNGLAETASQGAQIVDGLANNASQIGQLGTLLTGVMPPIGVIAERTLLIAEILTTLAGRQVVPLDTGFVATRTPVGWIVLPDTEIAALLHLADGRASQEPGTARFLQDQLSHGGHAIDVGAHVGMLTAPMARAVTPFGRVDALEPVPRNAEALRRTIVANSLEATAQVYQVAADAVKGTARFAIGVNGQMGTLIGAESLPNDTIEVATECLDDINPPGSRIDVVKIDVEGAELRVLTGMQRIIADNPSLVVVAELAPYHLRAQGVSIQDWLGAFARAGLSVASEIDEAARTVVALRPVDALEHLYTINIAFSASLDALAPANRPR